MVFDSVAKPSHQCPAFGSQGRCEVTLFRAPLHMATKDWTKADFRRLDQRKCPTFGNPLTMLLQQQQNRFVVQLANILRTQPDQASDRRKSYGWHVLTSVRISTHRDISPIVKLYGVGIQLELEVGRPNPRNGLTLHTWDRPCGYSTQLEFTPFQPHSHIGDHGALELFKGVDFLGEASGLVSRGATMALLERDSNRCLQHSLLLYCQYRSQSWSAPALNCGLKRNACVDIGLYGRAISRRHQGGRDLRVLSS